MFFDYFLTTVSFLAFHNCLKTNGLGRWSCFHNVSDYNETDILTGGFHLYLVCEISECLVSNAKSKASDTMMDSCVFWIFNPKVRCTCWSYIFSVSSGTLGPHVPHPGKRYGSAMWRRFPNPRFYLGDYGWRSGQPRSFSHERQWVSSVGTRQSAVKAGTLSTFALCTRTLFQNHKNHIYLNKWCLTLIERKINSNTHNKYINCLVLMDCTPKLKYLCAVCYDAKHAKWFRWLIQYLGY